MERPSADDDALLLAWISENTDASLSTEQRYFQALRAFRDRAKALAEPLRDFVAHYPPTINSQLDAAWNNARKLLQPSTDEDSK